MLQRKSLAYYQSLEYNIIVEKETMDNESWYIAYSKELGKYACYGQGETAEEALESYKNEKYDFITYLFQNKKPIPEPVINPYESLLSGTFNVRTTPELHTLIAHQASEQGVSLNQYVNIVLASKSSSYQVSQHHHECLHSIEKKLDDHHSFVSGKLNYSLKDWPKEDRVYNVREAYQYAAEGEYFYDLKKVG